MNLAAPMAVALALANVTLPRPDLFWSWHAPADYVPDIYEVQVATNLAQFQTPIVGTYDFSDIILWTHATNVPVFFSDAPQRFARVRAWCGICPSDWASVSNLSN